MTAVATTYTTLLADLQTYVDNDVAEFVAQAPGIINRAMTRIQRDLELSIWRRRSATSFDAASQTWQMPSGAIRLYGIIYDDSTVGIVERRSDDWVLSYSRSTGKPRYYAEHQEGYILLTPTPDQNYPITVSYLERLAPLVASSNETNWITDNVGDMLLWASLVGAERFLIGQERAQEFEAEYQQTMAGARAELRGLHDNDYAPLRTSAITTGLA